MIFQNQATLHPLITLVPILPSIIDHKLRPRLLALNSTQSGNSIAIGDMLSRSGRQPLYAGEWLEMFVENQTEKCRRVTGALGSLGTKGLEYTGSRALIGLSDAESPGEVQRQVNGLVSIYVNKPGAIFETTMVDIDGLAVGDSLSVWQWGGVSGVWGYQRSVLAKRNSGTVVAVCVAILDSNRSTGRIKFELV
jgi:hypothetical protein